MKLRKPSILVVWTLKNRSPQAFNQKQGVKQGTKRQDYFANISLYYHPLDKNFEVYSLYP
jgi:hypothetical protein